jgi:hypothetical protein
MARHLTLYDFRDLDLLSQAVEVFDPAGHFTTEDFATAIGFGDDLRAVGGRLGWMRRYGALARDEEKRLWRFTRGAERIIEADQESFSGEVDAVPDAALVGAMAHVMKRYRRGDALTATLMRREFFYGAAAARRNGR